jgi:cytochrome P450
VPIDDVTIPAGSRIVVADYIANRDPRTFPDPDTFDVARADNKHITFGFGPHACLGAPLARAELKSVFEAIVTRLPEYELVEQPRWASGGFRHLHSLRVRRAH